MDIGVRFKEIRCKLKLNQTEFSNKINVTQSAVSQIEKNIISPSSDVLINISNTYNVNLNWLLTGKGDMFLGQTPQTSEFQANNNELEKQQKRLQDLQKQVDLLKKNIQEIDIEYDQEKKRSSDLIHENQKLNRELLTLMRDLIDCKNLVIKLQQK